MINALRIHPEDNVAVVTETAVPGDVICFSGADGKPEEIKAVEEIPVYHKIALCDLGQDSRVIKYGETIGRTTAAVARGSHVHCHNVVSMDDLMG